MSGRMTPVPPRRLVTCALKRQRERVGARVVEDELPAVTYQRLTGALALLFGIDPIAALADKSDGEREDMPDALAWTAQQLVDAALAEGR